MIISLSKIAIAGAFYLTALGGTIWAVFRFAKPDTVFKCTTKPANTGDIKNIKNQKNLIFPNFK